MRKTLIEKISELEDKYHVISDNIIDALWVIDAQTLQYDYISSTAETFSGYSVDEFTNMTLKDRLTPESFKDVLSILVQEKKKHIKGKNKIGKFEVELINKDGSRVWAEIKVKFLEEKNQPLKIIGASRDITRQKKDEQMQVDLMNKLSDTIAEVEHLQKEVRILRELLPICSACKRIRDDDDKWWPIDVYVSMKTDTKLSHTLCHDCSDVLYGDTLDHD